MTPLAIGDLERDWTFRASPVAPRTRLKRLLHRATARRPAPAWRTIRPPFAAPRWNVLFLFAPSGALDATQRGILARVRTLEGRLLIVAATPHDTPPAGLDDADALIVKEPGGFDFSAYRIALDAIAAHAPGATAYVQNDSVLGPFGDIDGQVDRAPWDLTGFIGARAVENHISSFAFVLRDVTPARLAMLRDVLSADWSHDAFDAVILMQETRLARMAARGMTVGAYWYVPAAPARIPLTTRLRQRLAREPRPVDIGGDATLACPVALLDAGFPFLKRSLFTKFAGLHDEAHLRDALRRHGWYRHPFHAADHPLGLRS